MPYHQTQQIPLNIKENVKIQGHHRVNQKGHLTKLQIQSPSKARSNPRLRPKIVSHCGMIIPPKSTMNSASSSAADTQSRDNPPLRQQTHQPTTINSR